MQKVTVTLGDASVIRTNASLAPDGIVRWRGLVVV